MTAVGGVAATGSAPPSGVLVVSGTGTGVGKTIVTAAVAAVAASAGRSVAVVKAAQTGVGPDEPADLAQISALTGLPADSLREVARYRLPLAPATAARLAGLPQMDPDACAGVVRSLASCHDLVLVEGAGGLLVRLCDQPPPAVTVADLARSLGCPVVVVVDPWLGTLNHTALTLEALAARGVACAGLVVGRWPAHPDLACRANLEDLRGLAGADLAGVLADGAGRLSAGSFLVTAGASLGPGLGGTFDAADFRRRHRPFDGPDREE